MSWNFLEFEICAGREIFSSDADLSTSDSVSVRQYGQILNFPLAELKGS